MKVVLSAQARAALREIALFIARANTARAMSFVQELREAAQGVGNMPPAFPLVPRYETPRYETRGLRRRRHGSYLIFYRVEDDRVSIVHILHAARDYEALLCRDD
jgi:plasmid stabilization system protein ParE